MKEISLELLIEGLKYSNPRLDDYAHEINEHSKLKDDLGLTSLDIVEAIMHIEAKLDIVVPDVDYEGLKTVGELLTTLTKIKK